MIRQYALLLPCFLLASLSQTGCAMDAGMDAGMDADDDQGDLAETQQPSVTTNSLTWNSLTSNSLTSNSLTSNSLTSNSLTSNSLTSNSLVMNALNNDTNSRSIFYYIAGCALDPGDYVDILIGGSTQRFWGQLGIAPEWGMSTMSCDTNCQIAVSSCVLSRINYAGTQVQISLRGGPACVEPDNEQEMTTFNAREAAFFGNIFTNPQQRYACLPAGKTSLPRVCGPSLTGCVVNVIGTCNCLVDDHGYGEYDLCDFPGYPDVAPLTVFLDP
jgi:hypothetical protein